MSTASTLLPPALPGAGALPRAGALLGPADDGAARRPVAGTIPGATVGLLGLGRVGAGLVAVASGADHLRHAGGAPWGATLVALGVAAGAWGLLDLRRRRAPGRRGAATTALAGGTWAAVATSGLLPGPGGLPHTAGAADASLVTLLLVAAATAAARARAGGPAAGPARVPGQRERQRRTVPRLVGWAGGALLVAGLTATGLAGTEAGRHATGHGEHGAPTAPATPTAPGPGPAHPGH